MRCARRGLVCGYMVSRRTGRTSLAAKQKLAAPPTADTDPVAQLHNIPAKRPHEFQSTARSPFPDTPALTPPSTAGAYSENGLHAGPDVWRPMLSPSASAGDAALSPPTPSATNFDDLFASVFPSPMLETSEIGVPPPPDTQMDAPLPMDMLDEFSVSQQDLFSWADFGMDHSLGVETPPPEPRRCCLTVALELLSQLFPNAPTACTLAGSQATTCTVPTMESVISENKQIIEAASKVLDCPCSQDEYLLAIISLVVFKIMAWYAAAAGEKSVMDHGVSANNPFVARPERQNPVAFGEHVLHLPTTIGNYCVDGHDRSRMAAQLVLSELHRVQRLVNVISKRLECIRLHHSGVASSSTASSNEADSGDTQVMEARVSPLSAPTFYQLEADLRKRLRTVSSETIDILRRE